MLFSYPELTLFMKKTIHFYLPLLLVLLFTNPVRAQITFAPVDSVKKYQRLYMTLKDDKYLMGIYIFKGYIYRRYNADSGIYYGNLALKLAKKTKSGLFETLALDQIQYLQREKGNLAEALKLQLRMLALSKELNSADMEGQALNSIGNTYLYMGTLRTALNYYREALVVFDSEKDFYYQMNERSNIGNTFEKLNMPDSALFYEQKLAQNKNFPTDLLPELMCRMGNANVKLGKYKDALSYYKKGLSYATNEKTINDVAIINYQMAKLNINLNVRDSANYYAHRALNIAKSISLSDIILKSSQLLADIFDRQGKIDSAYRYLQIATHYNDILFGAEKFNSIQQILSAEQQRQQKLLQQQDELKKRYQLISGISILIFVLIVALLIWHNNLSQRKKNKILDVQKTQLTQQRDELQTTIVQLKQTQTQLIQSEKMASLGELTAGIAHEIQNPLNFVNNFSEVNTELIEEMQQEIENGDYEEIKTLAVDIKENQLKINHHGKRADFIVKGMLQHSRTSTGEKQETNINTLADEFLKLSYHGLRAKDKNFNANIATNFDEDLPKVNIVQQDIGRVLLNLFNNAFYAVNQKQKTAGADYQPEVTVTTSADNNTVVISVKDNGTGIPDSIKDKIMQPFFTTKPTGEGTGLGLSLSYDMVVKGHGGTITIETKEGTYTEFKITLPLN
jgi:two-component system NtrC family sensor kinase